jgi:hypothetical protein
MTTLALNELSQSERRRLGLPPKVDHLSRQLAEALQRNDAGTAAAAASKANGSRGRRIGMPETSVG